MSKRTAEFAAYDEDDEVVEEVEEELEEVPEDEEPARAPKKQKKTLMQENENAEKYGDLGRGKRVTVRAFQGRVGVDIREFYQKDGKMNPGKKGIWLTKDNYLNLLKYIPEISDVVETSPQ